MKFSLSWLGDFVEASGFQKNPEKLLEALTKAGLEAESLEDPGARFKNVAVAEILSVERHPRADRLTVCQAASRDPSSGGRKVYPIVCGAKNHKAGDKAALALPGAVLPGNFAIEARKIRGEISEGMLASAKELGLEEPPGGAGGGILILPPEAETGQSFASYLGLEGAILDLNVTPNRADCLSHYGLAREISCLFGLPLSERDKKPRAKKGLSVRSHIKTEVLDFDACPRYCGLLIQNVKIAESPPWLKKRLKSLGLKSINNAVDAANYVLWDQGQPLHAFDRDKIQSISVARSLKGESFKALDGQTLTLTGEELTIRDGGRAIALAGVIGGMDSAVSPGTKNIFLEAAFFRPEEARRTARRFGLQTDSSYRFSRGIDPEAVLKSLSFAAALIQELAGGEASHDAYDLYPAPPRPAPIALSMHELEERLGWPAAADSFESWMRRLKCLVKKKPPLKLRGAAAPSAAAAVYHVTPPSFRADLHIKEDLIEEFARLEGYDKVPEAPAPRLAQPKPLDSDFAKTQKLAAILRERGWFQAVNYSFSDPDFYEEFLRDQSALEALGGALRQGGAAALAAPSAAAAAASKSGRPGFSPAGGQPGRRQKEAAGRAGAGKPGAPQALRAFSLKNPISSQLSLMKPLLLPDLFKSAAHNLRHNSKWGQLFEISPVFFEAFDPSEGGREGAGPAASAPPAKREKAYIQTPRLGLIRWGQPLDLWRGEGAANNLFHIKSLVEAVLRRLGIEGFVWSAPSLASERPFLRPRQFLALKAQARPIGFIGSIHPRILARHKISADMAAAELNLENLWSCSEKSLKVKPLPALPFVEKDFCFVIPMSVSVGEAKKEMRKALGPLCAGIEIFDLYEKQGERSVSFRVFLAPEGKKPWTEAGLQECQNKVIERMRSRLGLSLRS